MSWPWPEPASRSARHGLLIERIGGAPLVGVGVLFVSGAWRSFFVPLQRSFAELGWPPI